MLGSFSPVGGTHGLVWERGNMPKSLPRESNTTGKQSVKAGSLWHGQHHWRDHRGSLCLQLPGKDLGFRQPAINYYPGLTAWTCQFPSVFCFVTVRKSAPPDWFLEVSHVLCHSSVSLTIQLKFHSTQAGSAGQGWEGARGRGDFRRACNGATSDQANPILKCLLTSQVGLACVSHLTRCWLSSWQDDIFDVLTPLGVPWWKGISGWLETKSHTLFHSKFWLHNG